MAKNTGLFSRVLSRMAIDWYVKPLRRVLAPRKVGERVKAVLLRKPCDNTPGASAPRLALTGPPSPPSGFTPHLMVTHGLFQELPCNNVCGLRHRSSVLSRKLGGYLQRAIEWFRSHMTHGTLRDRPKEMTDKFKRQPVS